MTPSAALAAVPAQPELHELTSPAHGDVGVAVASDVEVMDLETWAGQYARAVLAAEGFTVPATSHAA